MSRNKITRRGFTLVELIIAGIIAVIVVGTLGTSLSQLARARASSKVRLNAHLRANTALEKIRRELQQVIRSDNLIDTRILLTGDSVNSPIGDLARNDVLIYSTKLSPVRNKTYEGDGIEHEVQLRVTDDESGSALWMRDDAVPDDNEGGGGKAAPMMDGIIGLYIEASDGTDWYDSWDSDINGLPVALRVTVSSAGDAQGADFFADSRELMSLRTIVPIDRVPPPYEEPPAEDPASAAGGEVAAADAAGAAAAAIEGAAAAGINGTQGGAGGFSGGGRGRQMGRGGQGGQMGGRGGQGGQGGQGGGRGGQGGQGGQGGGRGGQGGQGGGMSGNPPANQGTGGRPN
mgnify:FL=1